MTELVTEALLEMLYYEPLRSLFEEHYGRQVIRILKPSPRTEAFFGFDQGWVSSSAPFDFLRELKRAIQANSTTISDPKFFGFFLQFKRGDILRKSNRRTLPQGFVSPYIRFALDLSPNRTTGRSQHETLLRLAGIKHADVSYACPMLIHTDDVLESPSLDTLKIVPIASAPQGYATNQKHYIVFQDRAATQHYWCSEPQAARTLTAREWITALKGPGLMNTVQLLEFLTEVSAKMDVPRLGFSYKWEEEMVSRWPECLSIIEFESSSAVPLPAQNLPVDP